MKPLFDMRAIVSAFLLLTSVLGLAQDAKPNILLIYIDDLRTELGAYGVPRAKTPNLDALVGQSLLFSSAYCQYPVCGPSRSSALSGLTPDQLGIYGNEARLRELLTLPQAFQRAGYETVSIGKVFDQRLRDPKSWNAEYFFKQDALYAHAENRRIHEENAAKKDGEWKVGPPVEIGREGRDIYEDEKIAAKAHEELKRLAAEKERSSWQSVFTSHTFPSPHPRNTGRCMTAARSGFRTRRTCLSARRRLHFGTCRAFQGVPKDGPLTDDAARGIDPRVSRGQARIQKDEGRAGCKNEGSRRSREMTIKKVQSRKWNPLKK